MVGAELRAMRQLADYEEGGQPWTLFHSQQRLCGRSDLPRLHGGTLWADQLLSV